MRGSFVKGSLHLTFQDPIRSLWQPYGSGNTKIPYAGKETGTQRGSGTYSRSHSYRVAELGVAPGLSVSRDPAHNDNSAMETLSWDPFAYKQ